METIRTWLSSVVMVTMLLSLVQQLIPEGSVRKVASFTGGLILLAALLQPLLRADFSDWVPDGEAYRKELSLRETELARTEEDAWAQEIKALAEQRLQEEARRVGADVTVYIKTETGAEGVPLPAEAEITGPYTQELAVYMEEELGIPPEQQNWIVPE